jgi:hypothetical protein
VCRGLGSLKQATEYARAAETALAKLGFVAGRRYSTTSRPHEPWIFDEQDGQRQRS